MPTTPKALPGKSEPLSLSHALRILVVEDTPADAELMVSSLQRAGYDFSFDIVNARTGFKEKLRTGKYDVVISDHNLQSWTGLDALEILKQEAGEIPFIVVTGTLGDEAAVAYIKQGASDYVLKDRLEMLPVALGHTLREKANRDAQSQLQARILAGKKEWELTFDSVPDAVIIIDNECRVTRANRAATEVFGLPFSKLVGRPCYEVIHGATHAPADCPHERLLKTCTSQRYDCQEQRLAKTFDVTSTPLRDQSGTFLGCIHVMRDISGRKRAEQSMRHSEERYHSLIAATSHIVWTADPSGEVIEDQAMWREFSGKSEAETLGRGWLNLIHPDDRARVAESWFKAVTSRSLYWAEGRAMRSDGKYRDLLIRGVPVAEADGSIREWVGACTDITDQHRLEDQLRQAQKMEAMGRLAGGISHDFNNLLGVIIGYCDLLLGSPSSDDQSHPRVEQIKKAGQRAATLTRQLLAFSRKHALTATVIDLNTLIYEASKMLIPVLGEDIKLITKLGPDASLVKVDPTQMDQVIMNLAINARDAMPNGGTLRMETTQVELDQQLSEEGEDVQPGAYVCLTVSDTGIGMTRETEGRIFEPFFTTKEVGKGTGLGLATVYGIVKQSGGQIRVSTEPGMGSSFKIYLPKAKEIFKPSNLDQVGPIPLGSETILLVEDDNSLRALSHELLESMGYEVIDAANGQDALRIAGGYGNVIQLLITDVVMPGINGRELAELLAPSRPHMRVLYVSGHADDVAVHYALLNPDVAFLQKPFTRDVLARSVKRVLGASESRQSRRQGATG